MIERDELLKMAREAACGIGGQFIAMDVIALSEFANAILERAAVECARSENYSGTIFAQRIRALKTKE